MHSILAKAAKGHSVDKATRNYFDHYSPEDLAPEDRIKKIATIPNMYGWGENISAGRSSVFESHISWINSLGHRENMLKPIYTHLGYGVGYSPNSTYGFYYTTKFIAIRN